MEEIKVSVEPIGSNIYRDKGISEVKAIFSKYKRVNMSNFKFDREEANHFDE